MFDRPIDKSDTQWRVFRSALPHATLMFLAYWLGGIFLRWLGREMSWSFERTTQVRALVAAVAIVILHGLHSLKIFLLLSISFFIGKAFKGHVLNPLLTWIYSIATLLYIAQINSLFHPVFDLLPAFYPRWHVTFNMSILRLISFNMDYFWAHRGVFLPLQHRDSCKECITTSTGTTMSCEKLRIQEPPPNLNQFNLGALLAYVLYPPLYLAGPIITFNNFNSQLRQPQPVSAANKLFYAVRLIGSLLLLETLQHYIYVMALKEERAWHNFSASEYFTLVFFSLTFVYLKLLIIWRFFRLWAMLDGINTVENMERCIHNTHSGMAFWRHWHRSFNQWLIRYMYVPLGGSKYPLLNIWPIFFFVALWHDVEPRLFVWSLLICAFILPEMAIRWASNHFGWHKHPHHGRATAFLAGINILMMGLSNMVGFVVGPEGVKEALPAMKSIPFIVGLVFSYYSLASIQLELRATERLYGVIKNH